MIQDGTKITLDKNHVLWYSTILGGPMKDQNPMPLFDIILRKPTDEKSWFELALEELEKEQTKEN